MHGVVGGGGSPITKIEYDSGKTLHGVADVENQLKEFMHSTDRIVSEFDRLFADLSGESINRYREVVNEYIDGAKLAETYIERLIQIVHLMDREIMEADRKSASMLNGL